MNNELAALRADLIKEKELSEQYKVLYEEEKLKNENLHNALMDLRKKCERWYNSAEMEEELIVNKLMLRLDELKKSRDSEQSLSLPLSKSLDLEQIEFGDQSSDAEKQKLIDSLRAELEEKEQDLEILRLRMKAMKRNHSVTMTLATLSEDEE